MIITSYGLDAVNVSFLSIDNRRSETKSPPLVISPRWDSSLGFVTSWCRANRLWLDEMIQEYGAILLRGFDVNSPADMEKAIQGFQPSLNDTYRGTSPRNLLAGTTKVFSAAEVPTNYPIAQHIEMSFLRAPPRQLFFGCIKPSKTAGGETALADFRQVYKGLSPELKQKFLDKGIRYTRTHKKVGSYFTYDVSDMLGWPELFGTSDITEVERMCAAEGTQVQWHGDTFVSTIQSEAFQLHPITREPVWFNHTQVFHWTTFPAELWFAFRRTQEWRLFIHFLFVTIFCVIKYGLLGHKMSLQATFGDGEPISIKEMQEIRRVIHKSMVFSRWQKGDLLLIDNFSTSHGRQPTYDKGRMIAVSWSDPLEKANDLTSLSQEEKITSMTTVGNPQERTPESTLTRSESVSIKEGLCGVSDCFRMVLEDTLSVKKPKEFSEKTLESLKKLVDRAETEKNHIHKRCHSQPSLVHSNEFWQAK